MNIQNDFEAWAKLLLTRKVPHNFSHLINSEVIHSGADILKHGGAFEVRLDTSSRVPNTAEGWESAGGRVFVTPIVPRTVRPHAN